MNTKIEVSEDLKEEVVTDEKITTLKKAKNSKQKKKKININFDGDINEAVEGIIKNNSLDYKLPIQLLSSKDIARLLQRQFKTLEFEVFSVDTDNSQRIIEKFLPRRFSCNSEGKTFLDELWDCEEINFEENEKISWTSKKLKVSMKPSKYNPSDEEKSYNIGNTPRAIKINIKKDGENVLTRPIFTVPGFNIDKCTLGTLYKNLAIGGKIKELPAYKSSDYAEDNKYKVVDMNYLISLCKVLEDCYNFIDYDPSFLYDSNMSYYGIEYSVEDMSKLLDVRFLSERSGYLDSQTKKLVCECAIAVSQLSINEILTAEYRRKLSGDYARSFETKKYIPNKHRAIMKNNRFLENFNFVEIDEQTDIEKFFIVQKEFFKVKEHLKLDRFLKKDVDLRFRRLGQHKASGLYYPTEKCICVDINTPSSFLHEVAHHIDKVMGNVRDLSSCSDFRLISIAYKSELDTLAQSYSSSDDIEKQKEANGYKGKRGYLHTPTEVFARCFEMYLIKEKGMKSSFLPSEEELTLTTGYIKNISSSLLEKISNYFNSIFDIQFGINTTSVESTQASIELNSYDLAEMLMEDTSTEAISNTVENQAVEVTVGSDETTEPVIVTEHDFENANFIFNIIKTNVDQNERTGYRRSSRRRNKGNLVEADLNSSQLKFF